MPDTHGLRLGAVRGRAPARDDLAKWIAGVSSSRDIDELAGALREHSPELARAAIRRLEELGTSAAIATLRDGLPHVDVAVVTDVAKALIGDTSAVQIAVSALSEDEYTQRVAGAIALGVFDDRRTTPALCHALTDPIAAVRLAALKTLARLPSDPSAGASAAKLLEDESPQVRGAAVRLVARSHPEPGALLNGLADDDELEVRLALAEHMNLLNRSDRRRLLADRDKGVRTSAARFAATTEVDDLGRLLAEDRCVDVRCAVAKTLGRLEGEAATQALLAGIEDWDGVVRVTVIRALEDSLTRDGAARLLRDQLGSERARRRRASLYALARLAAADHGEDVWRLVDDPDVDVRLAVAESAEKLVDECQPLLSYMCTDTNIEVRQSAARRLACIGMTDRSRSD